MSHRDDLDTRLEGGAPPHGVAPIAIEPPAVPGRRRRLVYAAIVSGTLMTAPLASQPAAVGATRTPTWVLDSALAPEERTVPPASWRSVTGLGVVSGRSHAGEERIAWVGDLEVVSPSPAAALIGFHESFNAAAAPLAPAVSPAANHGSKPLPEIPEEEDTTSRPGVVLPTRGRPGAATSAVDIAIPDGEEVLAPVSGEVVAVSPYFLYGEHPDVRIDITPEGRPDLRVAIIHVTDVDLKPGSAIVAGETRIAGSATRFPFESQIDRFVEDAHGETFPHIHLEVTSVG